MADVARFLSIWPLLVAVPIVALASCRTEHAALAPADAAPRYELGPGDRIEVRVFGHEELSGEFEVDGLGAVSLPLVGNLSLGHLTIPEAEAAIEGELSPGYLRDPQVAVQVVNYRPFFILGEVNDPGSYPYQSDLTVVEAVALAGGFTYRADDDEFTILRTDDAGDRELGATARTVVLPGDTIRVEERFF